MTRKSVGRRLIASAFLIGVILASSGQRAQKSDPLFQAAMMSTIPSASLYEDAIAMAAKENGVDPLLIKSIIKAESDYDPRCISPKGARGLMQLQPATARCVFVKNIFNPADNIRGGTRHLAYLMKAFGNNLPLSLAAYNAGEGPVRRYKGIPPYAETRVYVTKVLRLYTQYCQSAILPSPSRKV